MESTIAEKFDAMLQRFELTSRMKDFYDIYYLSRTFDFDGDRLLCAFQQTLQNRGTEYDKESFNRILALAEDESMQVKWRHFLKSLGNAEISFSVVLNGIETFLAPVWDALIRKEIFEKCWNAKELEWHYIAHKENSGRHCSEV